jgi:uncharacterized protein (TIGR01777 family)
MRKVLITGGTGFIGKVLVQQLLSKGYEVGLLSRSPQNIDNVTSFLWNAKDFIDLDALRFADVIVHLAGENVGSGRWTKARKQRIRESRVTPIKLIREKIKEYDLKIDTFISASGIGYYGNGGDKVLSEENTVVNQDFLSDVCVLWENEAATLNDFCRAVSVRVGFVLDKDSEAFQKLSQPIKYGLGSPLGSGEQYVSWIHLQDLIRVFIKVIEDETFEGQVNGCSPNPICQETLTKAVASAHKKSLFLPNVPSFALKLLLGEMSDLVISGCRAVPNKLIDHGFSFKYRKIEEALSEIVS